MDRITVLRVVLAVAFATAGIVTRALQDESERLQGPMPRWLRVADSLYFGLCMWGAVIMAFAIGDSASAFFVRDWLSWALPIVVVWPPLRRVAGIRKLIRDAQGLAKDVP